MYVVTAHHQVKSLISPLLCKLVFSLLYPTDPELGNAAFIYGAIPTAAGVFTCVTSSNDA
jgi:hypothetical protein